MNGWIREDVDDEVAGGRASLATKCGIPVSDIQGFRQPYLQASPTVREVRTPLLDVCVHAATAVACSRMQGGAAVRAGGRQACMSL